MNQLHAANDAKHQYYDVYEIGGHNNQTLYFIGPYKGRATYFKRFTTQFNRKGYRIIYLQPKISVLDVAKPRNLANAVAQAAEFIQNDIQKPDRKVVGLVGISLGSYIGLNIITRIPFAKFVVVAGGSPLLDVLAESRLFRASRRKIERLGNQADVHMMWSPYDNDYKMADLCHTKVLFMISRADKLITTDGFQAFLNMFKKTGAQTHVQSSWFLSHTAQALSTNWRIKQIDNFLNS